jgi:hypothetical protein
MADVAFGLDRWSSERAETLRARDGSLSAAGARRVAELRAGMRRFCAAQFPDTLPAADAAAFRRNLDQAHARRACRIAGLSRSIPARAGGGEALRVWRLELLDHVSFSETWH